MITKRQATILAGGTITKLAELFDISHSAVSQWGEYSIPKTRQDALKKMFSEQEIEAAFRKSIENLSHKITYIDGFRLGTKYGQFNIFYKPVSLSA